MFSMVSFGKVLQLNKTSSKCHQFHDTFAICPPDKHISLFCDAVDLQIALGLHVWGYGLHQLLGPQPTGMAIYATWRQTNVLVSKLLANGISITAVISVMTVIL